MDVNVLIPRLLNRLVGLTSFTPLPTVQGFSKTIANVLNGGVVCAAVQLYGSSDTDLVSFKLVLVSLGLLELQPARC